MLSKNQEQHQQQNHDLPFQLQGNIESNNLLIFMHSYPTSYKIFTQYYQELQDKNYILIISYPNYPLINQLENNKGIKQEKVKNQCIKELIQQIKQLIDQVNEQNRNVILIAHGLALELVLMYDQTFPHQIRHIIGIEGLTNLSLYKLFSFNTIQLTIDYLIISMLYLLWHKISNLFTIMFVKTYYHPSIDN